MTDRILIRCKACRAAFNIPLHATGKRIRCPGCRGVIDVDAAQVPSSDRTPVSRISAATQKNDSSDDEKRGIRRVSQAAGNRSPANSGPRNPDRDARKSPPAGRVSRSAAGDSTTAVPRRERNQRGKAGARNHDSSEDFDSQKDEFDSEVDDDSQYNPYEAPALPPRQLPSRMPSRGNTSERAVSGNLPLATQWQRFATNFIDGILFYILLFVLIIILSALGVLVTRLTSTSNEPPSWFAFVVFLTVWGSYPSYYILMEYCFHATIGKMIMGTRVVTVSGGNPSFGQVVGRTAARFIPFEPFSFLTQVPVGWHDSLSGTRVIQIRGLKRPR